MHNVKNDSGIDKAHQATSQDLTSPQTIGLTDGQAALVNAAHKEAYKDETFCPHYTFSANESTNSLELDVAAAPLVWQWSLTEFISVFMRNKLKGHFKDIDVVMFHGTETINGLPSYQNLSPIKSMKGAFLLYQLDEQGEVISDAHDIELSVYWHKSMTKTDDCQLIEQLFERVAEPDFTLEELEKFQALI